MIAFHYVKYKNFMATGNAPTTIKLDKNKTTLVVGRNGVGKSSCIEAITFALYNKAFRNINKPALVNSINEKDCVVELQFSIQDDVYKIVRGIKPNIFEIYKNESLLNQSASDRDYQEILETQILRMSYRTFCQVVILGSASYVPFMQLPTWHRREIIENLLDIQIFSLMNTALKGRVLKNKEDLASVKSSLDIKAERKKMQYEIIKRVEESAAEHRLHLEEELLEVQEELRIVDRKIGDSLKSLNDLSGTKGSFEKARNRLSKIQSLKEGIISKMEKLDSDVKFYLVSENCPTCRQSIHTEFKDNMLLVKRTESTSAKEALDKIKLEYEKTLQSFEETKKLVELLDNESIRYNTLRKEQLILIDRETAIRSNIEKVHVGQTENIEADRSKLSEIQEEIAALEEQRITLLSESAVLGQAGVLLKDDGIKSRIIKQYIPIINKLINKYLATMDFFVNFELDENFEETIKSRGRDSFSYSSFSEGEKSRINIAILLAWRAIAKMRNTASTSLLMLDEIFDSSIDSGGSDDIAKILEELSSETHVFVISHRESMYDKFHSVVKFEKHGLFSRIAS